MNELQLKVAPAASGLSGGESQVCSCCRGSDVTSFFATRKLPVTVGVFYNSRDEALAAPTGKVTLAFCHSCGHVFNSSFEPELISYRPGYEVALHHSGTFQRFMKGVASRLIERFDLRGKNILEIGCGCGYFLRLLCEQGGNHGIGVDPTVPAETVETVGRGTVRFVREHFDEQQAGRPADFICCLSVLEHIPRPLELLSMLRRSIHPRRLGIYFEVFNAYDAICREETWSVHYEQCSYFSQQSLAGVFRRSGFEIIETGTCYEGDQYLFIDAVPGAADESPKYDRQDLPGAVTRFADSHKQSLASWNERLAEYRRSGRRAVVWGTGGKGISFLNALDTTEVVPYVVEINPDKQGRYVPGSAQRIEPPEHLALDPPDAVIVTNALYRDEMRHQAREFGVECEFLIA